MSQKPSIPKGTRDFGRKETAERNYIFDTVRGVYTLYGYFPIETPAMENLSTLLGKYGDEGDKLLYRILNSGDAFAGVDYEKPLTPQVCEKGLRYDLTVPFARYVVQHQSDLVFPFRRSQVQPVWRADRPQKGRYREFYQCDADIIGSKSQLCELELVQMVDEIFGRLGLKVLLKINNRKILTGLAEVCGATDKVVDITVAIDKLDKTGLEEVKADLRERGLDGKAISTLEPILTLQGSTKDKIGAMRSILATSEQGQKGLDEVEELFGYIAQAGIQTPCELDLSLARGLNYYTGAIFEVKSLEWEIGSICGGGRYDNLTDIFGLKDMSGVGISFGADRIYDCMKGLGRFPDRLAGSVRLLFANMGETQYLLPIARRLRDKGIPVEIFPEQSKLKKQFEYANRSNIPFISICGSDEKMSGTIQIKNLNSGEQKAFGKSDMEGILSFLN